MKNQKNSTEATRIRLQAQLIKEQNDTIAELKKDYRACNIAREAAQNELGRVRLNLPKQLERKLHFANKHIERLKRQIEHHEAATSDVLRGRDSREEGLRLQLARAKSDVEAVRQSNKGLAEKTIAQAARIEHLEGELSRLTADWAGECRAKESLQTKLKELFDLKEGSLGQWGADDLRRQLQESKNRESVVLNALDEEKKRSDELATARDLFYQKNGEAIRTICKLESENAQLIETGNAATEQLAELRVKLEKAKSFHARVFGDKDTLTISIGGIQTTALHQDWLDALESWNDAKSGKAELPGLAPGKVDSFESALVKFDGRELMVRPPNTDTLRCGSTEFWVAAFDAFSVHGKEVTALSQEAYEAVFAELEAAYNAAAVCDQPNYAHCLFMLRKAYETTN